MKPSSFTMSPIDLPLAWLSLDTRVSAGWETIAQKTPAERKGKSKINTKMSSYENVMAI